MEGSNIESPLMKTKSSKSSTKLSFRFADAAELFVLFCSALLITTSVVFVAIVFCTASWYLAIPETVLSYLERIISSLSLTVTSAVIMVAGKQYVLFKLARGGLRSQRVAVYNDPTIENLASHMVLRGVELPLLGLSAVWGLALATGLTVTNSWTLGSESSWESISELSGPFYPSSSNSFWVTPGVQQLTLVMSSLCLGLADTIGVIKITSADTDPNHPTGTIYYPPLTTQFSFFGDINTFSFSIPATMNGFDISLEQLSSVPSTASNLTSSCQITYLPLEL